ncbi:hypothetical protein AB9P05_08900 [Roseivirga sp. BDSF3-8]|uniref:hypothetical protein n=1 Tax=Roseivirga sp. BDSF3-8 TaxID=3241598 RepID=UPI003531E860
MFRHFRLNDPYRFISITFLLVLMRLPFLLTEGWMTRPELYWMLVGDKLSAGAIMYTEVWTDTGPVAALCYWILDLIFGRSHIVYAIVSMALVLYQAVVFNNFLLRLKAYKENTYVPAMFYVLLTNIFFDMSSLPPALIMLTFLLPALRNVFSHIESRTQRDEVILMIGLYMGLAGLCLLPAVLFIIPVLLAFFTLTGTVLRRYLMLLIGFTLPFLAASAYYYWMEALPSFYTNFVYSAFNYDNTYYLNFYSLLIIVAVPGFYLAAAILKTLSTPQFNNFQTRVQQTMLYFLITAVVVYVISNKKSPYQFLPLVPFAAFYLSHYFLLIRRKLVLEIQYILLIVLIVFVNHGTFFSFSPTSELIEFQNLLVSETPYDEIAAGKKVLVLGNEVDVYRVSEAATPYLQWNLSRRQLEALEYYDNLIAIRENFLKDMPDIIIDTQELAPTLFNKVPEVGSQYRETGTAGIYARIPITK